MPEIVAEVILDHIALVAEAQDKIVVPMGGIGFHDVPEDGAVADGHHGFGTEFGFLPEPGAFATAEYDDFHVGCSESFIKPL